jgi:fucose permease
MLGLVDNIRAPFYPDILESLHLSATKGSLFFATASFAALGGNFLGSFLLSRVTAHGLMNFSVFGVGVGFLLIGQATDFSWVIYACIFFGIHFGLLNVSQNVVVQKNASLKYRRRIFNGLHTMYGLAALLAPLLASGFLDLGWNWNRSFSLIGVVCAFCGLAFLITAWKWKEAETITVTHQEDFSFDSLRAFFIAVSLGFYIMTELSLSTRLPVWVTQTLGASGQEANSYLAVFFLGMFLSRLLFTFVSFEKFSNRKILWVCALSGLLFYSLGLLVHPFYASLTGLFIGPFFPVILDEMSSSFHDQAAKVIGWSITLGSVLVVLMHFSVGVLTDRVGIQNALWVGPVGFILSLAALFLSSKKSFVR